MLLCVFNEQNAWVIAAVSDFKCVRSWRSTGPII